MTKKPNTQVKSTKKKSNGMSKGQNKSMRKNILNFAYSTLHSKLSYKAAHLDRLVVFVDPTYTTQGCSSCGSIQKIDLKTRRYICDCGLNIDRDLNSAINILTKGMNFFEELLSSSFSIVEQRQVLAN